MLIGLLEDDLAIQEMLRFLLQSEKYEVKVFVSPEECFASLRVDAPTPAPDLLMIDLHLAKAISGLDLIKQCRADPRLSSLPMILMTASAFIDKQELQHLRVTLLPKPFDIDEILRVIENLLQNS